MIVLSDSNILTKYVNPSDPQHSFVHQILSELRAKQHLLALVPQVLYELWVVATRLLNLNGLGMSSQEVLPAIIGLRRNFDLYLDLPGIYSEWERLVDYYQVMGKKAHDTRLVEAMKIHRISHLLTFNQADFNRYSEISLLDPLSVMSSSP